MEAATLMPVRGHHRADAGDDELVEATRRGDDRAFEALYQRYHRRIAAYVLGMVKDHQRAEDVTQEVFLSALRRMRATDRAIAFKPWIYEIAKNACIDQFRRARRTDEVPLDGEDGSVAAPAAVRPGADAAVLTREQLGDLCGAFGGLSETHHRILVLRELEGRTYEEIGREMEMTRPAVESTLFRARRRLGEEYGELVSGERCRKVQAIIAAAQEASLGVRDRRTMARHVAHCQPCRRAACLAGVRDLVPERAGVRARIAAFLPLPAIVRGLSGWLPASAPVGESAAGWMKAAVAAATIAAAGVGAGAIGGVGDGDGGSERAPAREAAPARPVAARSAATSAPAPAPAPSGREQAARPKRDRVRARDMGAARRASGTTHPGAVAPAQRPAGADRAPDGAAGPATEPSRAGGGSGGGGTAPAPRAPAATAPAASAPAASDPAPADPVTGAVGAATGGLLGDGVPLPSVPPPPSPPVLDTSNPVSGLGNLPATVQSTVEQTVDGVGATVAGAAGTAGAATQGLSDTVTGVGQRLGGG
ncbi:MAG TPA: sigma-70 family RNA polymerase sigma factor [Capillimicrobium sp.]|nr:sigma-70 family RNA polymerase sigma factor [Capillimicrobium sp.]